MTKQLFKLSLFFMLTLALVGFMACGGDDKGEETKPQTQSQAAPPKEKPVDKNALKEKEMARHKAQKNQPRPSQKEMIPFETKDPDKVVAKVYDQKITLGQVDNYIGPSLRVLNTRHNGEIPEEILNKQRQSALERIIREELQIREAKKRGISVDEDEYMKRIENYASRYPSKEDFYKSLERQGMDIESYKERLRRSHLTRKLMQDVSEDLVKTGDAKVKDYYEKNIQRFQQPEMVRVSQILIKVAPNASPDEDAKAKKKAEEILGMVKKGDKDFATIAREHSEGPRASNGGDLNFIRKGRMLPEFEEVAFNLKVDETSNVFKTKQGYHIIKVTDKKDAGTQTFDEVKAGILKQLQQQEVRKWLQKLRDEAKVQIML